ncbi:MAG TPA: LysM peptidoglycan-binding domain-containing protein [Chthoniobacterales bacterium]|jgi:LysM repeat protein
MKWLFALLLAVIIFGGAAWFGYDLFFKQEIELQKEQRGEIPTPVTPDISLPEFQAAAKLRQEGKLPEARAALTAFIQKYPNGQHVEEARDLLGEVNVDVFLSRTPSPDKEEYVVRSGDVLAKIAHKMKSTPELIMRMNNLNSTMLRIGERLLISHPEFSLVVQRKAKLVVLLDKGAFFKQYHVQEVKLPSKAAGKTVGKVAEIMAFRDGKRIGFGTKEYPGSTRWIRLSAPGYILYSMPDATRPRVDQAPPASGLGLAASDVEELSSLVSGRTTVTITD